MDMFFGQYGYHGASFEQTYRCYPASFIDKSHIENGDKVIMPPSALDRLASLHIDYPMLFELRNASTERVSHCGVLEFIAEEGMMYMPYWVCPKQLVVLQRLLDNNCFSCHLADDGESVITRRRCFTSEKCLSSQGLETALRNFSCLSTGDSIMVAYNNRKYYIDIIKTKPSNAICIIETDCEVEFAPPLDYKEPEKPVVSIPTGKSPTEGQEPPAETGPKFNPFTGVARRLDGRPLQTQPQPVTSNVRTGAPTASGQASRSSSLSNNRLSQGRLVFGSSKDRSHDASKDTSKGTKQEPPKIEEPKFQAFSGKKYSLNG